MLGYTIIRTLVVENMFAQYGVNSWLFLALDGATAVVYVIAIEHLVVAAWQRQTPFYKVVLWSGAALTAFALPYLYIFAASQTLPASLALGLLVVVGLFLTNAGIMLGRRIKNRKLK